MNSGEALALPEDRYWAGGHGRYNTYILTALLATVPAFERFLCRTMETYLESDKVTESGRRFANQLRVEEVEHIEEHDRVFNALAALGYPVDDIAKDTQAWLDEALASPLNTRMAYVALGEYNISNACRGILRGHPMYEGGHRPWLDYQLQHAEEEVSHYSLSLAICQQLNIPKWTFFRAYMKYSRKGTWAFISAIKHIHRHEGCPLSDRVKFWFYWYRTQYFAKNPVFLEVTAKSILIFKEVYKNPEMQNWAEQHVESAKGKYGH